MAPTSNWSLAFISQMEAKRKKYNQKDKKRPLPTESASFKQPFQKFQATFLFIFYYPLYTHIWFQGKLRNVALLYIAMTILLLGNKQSLNTNIRAYTLIYHLYFFILGVSKPESSSHGVLLAKRETIVSKVMVKKCRLCSKNLTREPSVGLEDKGLCCLSPELKMSRSTEHDNLTELLNCRNKEG